jgi:YVTN family beta-propeller protein
VATRVFADFTEPIKVATVSTSSFALSNANGAVAGSFDFVYDNSRVVFTPINPLSSDTQHTFAITAAITDETGLNLSNPQTHTFTTAAEVTEPIILSIHKPAAPVGSDVVISGDGFDPLLPENNIVLFNGLPAHVWSSTINALTVRVPQDASTGDVTVTVDGNTSDGFRFYVDLPGEDYMNEVIANSPTEEESSDSKPNPDGTLAYIVNSGSNNVSVVDLIALEVYLYPIPVGFMPLKIDIHPTGNRAYVTNYLSNTVSVISLTTGPPYYTDVEDVYTGMNPIGVVVTPDGSRVYVANYTSRDIAVIDAIPTSGSFNQVVANVPTESENKDIKTNPDGTLAFVTHPYGVSIININPQDPNGLYNTVVANAESESEVEEITVSPDGTLAFATTEAGDIIIIDVLPGSPKFGQVIASARTERGSGDIDTNPDGTLLYVTNYTENSISVYALTYQYAESFAGVVAGQSGPAAGADEPVVATKISLELVDRIEIADGLTEDPFALSVDPVGKKLIVAHDTSPGRVTIIDIKPLGTSGPTESVLLLIDDIEKMIADGILDYGDGNSLIAKLKAIQEVLEMGDIKAAKNKLNAFITKVNNLVRRGNMTEEDGDVLIEAAYDIMDEIDRYIKPVAEDDPEAGIIPEIFALDQNYPNPFNPSTTITYDIPASATQGVHVQLRLYNILGQIVRTLVDGNKQPGRYQVSWDSNTANGSPVASGIYIYRIEAGEFVQVRKMVLIR